MAFSDALEPALFYIVFVTPHQQLVKQHTYNKTAHTGGEPLKAKALKTAFNEIFILSLRPIDIVSPCGYGFFRSF